MGLPGATSSVGWAERSEAQQISLAQLLVFTYSSRWIFCENAGVRITHPSLPSFERRRQIGAPSAANACHACTPRRARPFNMGRPADDGCPGARPRSRQPGRATAGLAARPATLDRIGVGVNDPNLPGSDQRRASADEMARPLIVHVYQPESTLQFKRNFSRGRLGIKIDAIKPNNEVN